MKITAMTMFSFHFYGWDYHEISGNIIVAVTTLAVIALFVAIWRASRD